VIHLSRLNGQGFVLNPDLILKAESTPDTVVTLVDGTKFVVSEPLTELSDRVLRYRAQVVATARELPGCVDEPAAELLTLALADDTEPDTGRGSSSSSASTGLAEPVPFRRRRRP
jgi:flagellar protein FlbD